MPSEAQNAKPAETASYIARVARELKTLAARSDLSFLAYLLAMAEEEASSAARERKNRRR